jgi:hypothetical protein
MLSVIASINWPVVAIAGAAIVVLNKVLHKAEPQEAEAEKIDNLAEEPAPASSPDAELEAETQAEIAKPEVLNPFAIAAERALPEEVDYESPIKAVVTKVPSIPPSPVKVPISHVSVPEKDLIRALSSVVPSVSESPTPKVKATFSSRLKKALSKKGSKYNTAVKA